MGHTDRGQLPPPHRQASRADIRARHSPRFGGGQVPIREGWYSERSVSGQLAAGGNTYPESVRGSEGGVMFFVLVFVAFRVILRCAVSFVSFRFGSFEVIPPPPLHTPPTHEILNCLFPGVPEASGLGSLTSQVLHTQYIRGCQHIHCRGIAGGFAGVVSPLPCMAVPLP